MANTSVSLTDHHKKIIDQQVASGRYASTSDVIREGLRLVEEREIKRQEALAKLDALLEESETLGGRHIADDAFYEGIKKRGRQRLRAKLADLNKAA